MAIMQNGKSLSMHSDAVFKGTFDDNGTLLKLHENAYTIGYSQLLDADGKEGAKVKFGNGVFYKLEDKDNKVYAGIPTADHLKYKFAGILAREPGIASGYPAINNEVNGFQKGLLIREGYVVYKRCYEEGSAEEVSTFETVQYGDWVFAKADTGAVYFGSEIDTEDVEIGRVVEVNPDDKSVTVYISPKYYLV